MMADDGITIPQSPAPLPENPAWTAWQVYNRTDDATELWLLAESRKTRTIALAGVFAAGFLAARMVYQVTPKPARTGWRAFAYDTAVCAASWLLLFILASVAAEAMG